VEFVELRNLRAKILRGKVLSKPHICRRNKGLNDFRLWNMCMTYNSSWVAENTTTLQSISRLKTSIIFQEPTTELRHKRNEFVPCKTTYLSSILTLSFPERSGSQVVYFLQTSLSDFVRLLSHPRTRNVLLFSSSSFWQPINKHVFFP